MLNKIPRGVIYHRVFESVRYLFSSLFAPLRDRHTVSEFERRFAEYCGRKNCVAFPFARTAIYFALKHLDLPKGSEVILPPITIKGIVDVVLALDLVPVYFDLDPDTLSFPLDELERRVSTRARAVIMTPLFGLVPDMAGLVDLFRRRGIFVIEDFSQCLNGTFDGQRIGTFGDLGIYSASSIKTLDTLGGGLAVTDDHVVHGALRKAQSGLMPVERKFLIQKAWVNLLRNVATTRLIFSLVVFPLLQVMRRLSPQSTLKHTGSREKARLSRLPQRWFTSYSSLQAMIGLEHMDRVISEDRSRVEAAAFLKRECPSRRFPATTPHSANVYWQLMMMTDDAKKAQALFANHGVDTATTSLELVAALDGYPGKTMMPVAENIYHNGIFLPCYPGLCRVDLKRIADAVHQVA